MNIIMFLISNWDSTLIVIAAAGVLLYYYKNGEIEMLKEIIFEQVTETERDYGGGTGELKKAVVLRVIYGNLPAILKFILSKKELMRIFEDVLVYAKKKWKLNPNLREYVYGIDVGTFVSIQESDTADEYEQG